MNGRAKLGTPLLEVGEVHVVQLGKRQHFRTIFEVGVQSFILADADDREAVGHCKFIQKMFALALRRAGARIVSTRKVKSS